MPPQLPAGLSLARPDLDDDADLTAWLSVFPLVFGEPPPAAEALEQRRETFRSQRLTGVRTADRWVATFRSWPAELPVPGAATVRAELVSTVCVAPTHRRRGVLSALMADSLRHAKDSGATVASLVASEAAIYGRYGFGVGVDAAELTVDTARARAWLPGAPVAAGTVRLADDDELLAVGPAVYERARRLVPGAPPRSPEQWTSLLGRTPQTRPAPEGHRQVVVHVSPGGAIDGYLRLRLEGRWEHRNPRYVAHVEDLAAADPAVLGALWRYCLDLDLVATIATGSRPAAELVSALLLDRRAARITERYDMYWLRVLDPARALAARRWHAPLDVVLDVADEHDLAAGRWRLRAGPDGAAEVTITRNPPDISLDVAALAPLVTGHDAVGTLTDTGQVRELRPGAVAALATAAWSPVLATMTFQEF